MANTNRRRPQVVCVFCFFLLDRIRDQYRAMFARWFHALLVNIVCGVMRNIICQVPNVGGMMVFIRRNWNWTQLGQLDRAARRYRLGDTQMHKFMKWVVWGGTLLSIVCFSPVLRRLTNSMREWCYAIYDDRSGDCFWIIVFYANGKS